MLMDALVLGNAVTSIPSALFSLAEEFEVNVYLLNSEILNQTTV